MTVVLADIHIPLEIRSQNDSLGRHWRARATKVKKIRRDWYIACMVAMGQTGVPKASGARALHIVAYRKRRCSDHANLIGGAKPSIDGMVDAGLLIDDSDHYATITYEQCVASKSPTKKPHTTIRVRDL